MWQSNYNDNDGPACVILYVKARLCMHGPVQGQKPMDYSGILKVRLHIYILSGIGDGT